MEGWGHEVDPQAERALQVPIDLREAILCADSGLSPTVRPALGV